MIRYVSLGVVNRWCDEGIVGERRIVYRSVDSHGSGIIMCAHCALACIFPNRVRLYTTVSAMICTFRAHCNSVMVIFFHDLIGATGIHECDTLYK